MRLLSDLYCTALDRLDEAACHSNVYRATSFWFAQDRANCRTRTSHAALKLSTLERFADLRFDDSRSSERRRAQLDRIGPIFLDAVGEMAQDVRGAHRRNLAVQGQLMRARKLFAGNRGPDAAVAYFNRCRPNLTMPPEMVGSLIIDDRFRPAIRTAYAMADAHEGLRSLLGEPYFRRRLYSRTVAQGGTLTHWQIAADLAVLGLAVAAVRTAIGAAAMPALSVVAAAAACISAARFFCAVGKHLYRSSQRPADFRGFEPTQAGHPERPPPARLAFSRSA